MKLSKCIWLALAVSMPLHAADYLVSQKDKNFSPKTLRIKVGDSVDFRNDDLVSHNVFSLSDAKSFDLGAYPKGESRKVTFDKAGTVDVECAVHPAMRMKIEVTE